MLLDFLNFLSRVDRHFGQSGPTCTVFVLPCCFGKRPQPRLPRSPPGSCLGSQYLCIHCSLNSIFVLAKNCGAMPICTFSDRGIDPKYPSRGEARQPWCRGGAMCAWVYVVHMYARNAHHLIYFYFYFYMGK